MLRGERKQKRIALLYETVCLKNEQAVLKRFHYKSSYGDNINRLTFSVFNIFSLLAIVTMFSKYKKTDRKGGERKQKGKAHMYMYRRSVFSKRTAEAKPYAAVGAWFLGPKAENANIFTDLATKAFNAHLQFRKR